jgi:hypothetical protein
MCPSHQVRITDVGHVDYGTHRILDLSTGLLKRAVYHAEDQIRERMPRTVMGYGQSECRIGQA